MGHHLKASPTTKTVSIILAVTLMIGTMTVGLLPPLLSPMFIQSAEATPTAPQVPNCWGGSPTIVGTENDDVINGTKGDDVIVGIRWKRPDLW